MFHVDSETKQIFSGRKLSVRIQPQGAANPLPESIVKRVTYTAGCIGGDTIAIGAVYAASVTVELSEIRNLLNAVLDISVGADSEDGMRYLPLGTFKVSECPKSDYATTLTAFDAMYYAAGGTYVPSVGGASTVAQVLADAAAQCGVELAPLPAEAATIRVSAPLSGYQLREIIGYMAGLLGRNALFNREGKLELRWFEPVEDSITPSNYYAGGFHEDGSCTLAGIDCTVETGEDSSETIHTGGLEPGTTIGLTNPFMTKNRLDAIWTQIGSYRYDVASAEIFGGLFFEPGDVISCTNVAGEAFELPVFSATLNIDGGCRASLQASGESDTASSAAMVGSLAHQVAQTAQKVQTIAQKLGFQNGLYETKVPQSTGGDILYWHNAQKLEDSTHIMQITADAIGFSVDGGLTYPYGLTFDGAAVVSYLTAHNLTAEQINVDNLASLTADLGGFVIHDTDTIPEYTEITVDGRAGIDIGPITTPRAKLTVTFYHEERTGGGMLIPDAELWWDYCSADGGEPPPTEDGFAPMGGTRTIDFSNTKIDAETGYYVTTYEIPMESEWVKLRIAFGQTPVHFVRVNTRNGHKATISYDGKAFGAKNGAYFGLDGLSIGQNFRVKENGDAYVKSLTIGDHAGHIGSRHDVEVTGVSLTANTLAYPLSVMLAPGTWIVEVRASFNTSTTTNSVRNLVGVNSGQSIGQWYNMVYGGQRINTVHVVNVGSTTEYFAVVRSSVANTVDVRIMATRLV